MATALTDNSQQKPNKVGDVVVGAQAGTGAARVANTAIASERERGNILQVPLYQDSAVSKRPKSSGSRPGSVLNVATHSYFSSKHPSFKKEFLF